MNALILALATVIGSTNLATATSNVVQATTGLSVPVAGTNDPIEEAFHKVTEEDDKAHDDIDKWIREENAFAEKGAPRPRGVLTLRIKQRLEEVEKSYQNFVDLHPENVPARLAFGSFLNDNGDEAKAIVQWEKAREIEPTNSAAWNNLGTVYGHHGPIEKAFECFGKAIELQPKESLYYHNLAVHVYLFRNDAEQFYHLTETQVFDKSLDLYRSAIKYDPTNFILYTDYAESFYGTKPPRMKEGLEAWEACLKLARDETEREGVYIHLARIKTKLGRLDEARQHLDAVTNSMYASTKRSITRNLNDAFEKQSAPKNTNQTNNATSP